MAQLSATMAQFVAADGGPSCEDLRLRRPDRGSQGQEAVFQRRSESMDARSSTSKKRKAMRPATAGGVKEPGGRL
jgi:hypothetical protein